MSAVVADTSPINYLLLIGAVHVLNELFGEVFITSGVLDELKHPGAPEKVRQWASNLPFWVKVKIPSKPRLEAGLGIGERESIALADELGSAVLLLDDRAARRISQDLGIAVTGTIGILERAAEHGLVDLKSSLEALLTTNFRVEPKAVSDALERLDRKRNQ